jgi:LacI family transcriptional regulator
MLDLGCGTGPKQLQDGSKQAGLMPTEKLTIRQIAKLAGASRSSVSRVLNNHPNVSPELRDRVQTVIAETGYRPDPVARSLSNRRSNIIGLVIPLAIGSLFEDPFFPRLIQGVSQGCNAHDYTFSLFLFHSPEEATGLYHSFSHRQLLDGVIVTATRIGAAVTPRLLESQVPVVVQGRHEDPRVSYVDVDNITGAKTAVTHLLRLGCRRIATITGPLDNTAAQDRMQGYLDALQDQGRPVEDALILSGDFTQASGYEAMQQLLLQQPDAVFVASDTMATGALQAIRGAGLTVPDDLAVVGFDDLPQATMVDPPLTTVRQPIRRMGELAVELLIQGLEDGAGPPRRIVLPTELVIRRSCGSQLDA